MTVEEMGRDELKVGVRIRKSLIITTRICYRSVRNHPFIAGILLFLLVLYRSSPLLFSLLVSASPVFVCTAVLLGTLLSFGEPNIVPSTEEEDQSCHEIEQLKTGRIENTIVVDEDECFGRDSKYTELRREIVKVIDEEPLLDNTDRLDKSETNHVDVAFSSTPTDHVSREVRFEKQWIDEANRELGNKEIENREVEQTVNLGDQIMRMRDGVGLSDGEAPQTRFTSAGLVQAEHFEDYKSAEGSVEAQMSNLLVSPLESEKQLDEILSNSLSSAQDVLHENFEDYKSAEGSVDAQAIDQLEPSLASWKQFDVLDCSLSPALEVQDEIFEDYKLAEGSSEAQLRDHLESSLTSWKQFGSDHDEHDDSDSGSDGAESSSPDASMADIIPMLDELHPLLEDEIPQANNLSRQSSATMERSAKSTGSSFHSDDESDQNEEEGDADDDIEEETQGGKEDSAKSAIMWTEDDQKNLMDLGTSELERNQRLESLIARRRARKMMADRNLIDLDGMDLSFPVAPISTRRQNPFDYPHESYDDMGLPPIPGSAPSVLLPRRNPFDLPYDSSEEKPDLTGDSFQQEFMELTQRDVFNQREAIFRRNETFSMGSSAFDFGRPSRFRPYFVPERTDSDVMSYSSLQRQFSELSESKASSATETESISLGADQEEKKLKERDFVQEVEPSSEIDHASVLVQHGSQSSEDLDSLSGEEREKKDFVLRVPEVELGGASSSPAAASYTAETCESAENRLVYEEIYPAAESWLSGSEVSQSDIQLMTESIEVNHSISSSSLSVPRELNAEKIEDVDTCLVNMEQNRYNNVLNVEIPVKNSSEPLVSVMTTGQSLEVSNLSRATGVDDNHPKEPIYDLSPLKINHSSSSSSSDLQRETSGIDLYHLSRDLFVVEDSDIHNEDSENVSQHTKQEADDNGFAVNDIGEGREFDGTEFFSELNQLPDNSQESVVAEGEGHLSIDSSDKGIKDILSDDKVSPREVEQIFALGATAEIHLESRLDANRSLDDMPSADGHEFLEDSILAEEKKEAAVFGNDNDFPAHSIISCSQVELKEEIGMETEVNQQFQLSSPSLKDHENDGNEKLIFSLDENHFLPHDSGTHDNSTGPGEQESSIIHRKLEQANQLNKVDETVNDLTVQEPGHDKLSDPCQSNESFSQLEESETKSIAKLAIKEHVQDIVAETSYAYIVEENHDISEEFNASVVYEQIIDEERSDVKEMDEALLSELDAVGDFSVADMFPNLKNSMIHPNASIDSNIPAEVIDEGHSNIEMPFVHESLLVDSTHVEKYESERKVSVINLVETNQSDLDSDTGNASTDLLVLEAQSVEGIDDASKKVSEEVQNSVVAESVQAEYTRKEVEVPVPETELLIEDTKPEGCASEAVTLTADGSFIGRESVPDVIQPDLALPSIAENQYNLESDWRKTDSGMPALDAEIIRESGEDVEKVVEAEADKSDITKDLQTVAETGVGLVEYMPLQLDRDIQEVDESPVAEASTAPALERSNQTENVDSMEFESSQMDRDMKEISESSLLEESNTPALVLGSSIVPSVGSENQRERNTSEPLLLEEESGEIQVSSIVGTSIESALESESESVPKSESVQTYREVGETQELAANGGSIAPVSESEDHKGGELGSSDSLQLDTNIHEVQESLAVEASIPSVLESEEDKKLVGLLESEPLQRDRVVEGLQEWHVVDGSMSLAVESENPIEIPAPTEREPLQMDTDMQESPAQTSIAPAPESEDQILTNKSGESGLLLIDRNFGELQELPAVEEEVALAVESEGQQERVGSVESEPLQVDGEFKEIQESPVLQTSYPSAVESKDQMDNSEMEVVGVQGLQDHQSVEVDVPNADDSSEFHGDLSPTAQSSNNKVSDQGNSENATENFTSQVEEKQPQIALGI